MPGSVIENPVNSEAKNSEAKNQENLNKVKKEVDELKDADHNNDIVEGLSGLLTNEFGEFLKGQPDVLNSLFEACKDYKNQNPNVSDAGFEDLCKFLNDQISGNERKDGITSKEYTTNSIERFNKDMIKVTLRGKWDIEKYPDLNLDSEKIVICDTLNKYVDMWKYLPDKAKDILLKTKAALESISHIDEHGWPGSKEVEDLEKALDMPESPSREDIHDSVDGKFGDKTFDALVKYMDKALQSGVEVKAENINVSLRGEYKKLEGENLNKEKQNISDKINGYRIVWDYLPDDAKNLLLLTKTALETPSENNDTSKEVVALQNELGFANIRTADGLYKDGKFGDKTFNSLVNYMENLQLKPIESCEKWDFKVTLRGKRNAEGKTGEEKVKTTEGGITEIKGMLTPYVENWDKLPFEKKKILVLAKNALETESQIINKNGKEEPYSDEVVQLEDALVKVNAMPRIANDGNNGVDGKLGDKTMTALVAYLKKDEENMIK